LSGGKHAFRCYKAGDHISFLVADYSTGGGDGFFARHYADERMHLEEGSIVEGSLKIQLLKSKNH